MRTFELSDEAQAVAEDFIVGHNCSFANQGHTGKISYEFTEGSIGVSIHVNCGCGSQQDLTDYGEW